MKTTITATAPTSYQMGSLRAFRLNVKPHCYDSGATGSLEFSTKKEARDYLRKRAEVYNDADHCGTDRRLKEMFSGIKKGYLTLDAVTAHMW
jgi:hypothetical protein